MPKMVGGFQDQWMAARQEYSGCFHVVFFLPTGLQFKQVADYYAAEGFNLGVGDARGAITI